MLLVSAIQQSEAAVCMLREAYFYLFHLSSLFCVVSLFGGAVLSGPDLKKFLIVATFFVIVSVFRGSVWCE